MPTHITGFSGSGIDIESMIMAVLETERIPIYRLENEITEDEVKLSSWGTVETSVTSLAGKVQALTSYSTWQQLASESSEPNVATGIADDSAAEGTYQVHVESLATAHRIRSAAQTDRTSGLGRSGTFTLGGIDVTVGADDSLTAIRDAINTASASMADEDQVRATIVDTTLVLERTQTGDADIAITADADGVLQSLGLVDGSLNVLNELQASNDLVATVNGVDVSRAANTGLDDIIEGVTLNLFSAGDATVTVARDTASMRTLIEEFVDAYNETMSTLEKETAFDVEGDGRTGALQGDATLRTMQFKMRQLATATEEATLDPDFNSLRKIGIWTAGESNRLQVVDGEQLENALLNHFDEVEDLFRDFDGGILRSMDEYLDSQTRALDGAIATRQDGLQTRIDQKWDRISDLERRLEKYEESLWIKFAAMEQIMGEMNQQLGFIAGLLPGRSSAK